MAIWLDAEDLFHYALHHTRPTGIQRLCFELYSALVALYKDDVRFCRHDPVAITLRTVPWETLREVFETSLQAAQTKDASQDPDRTSDFSKLNRPSGGSHKSSKLAATTDAASAEVLLSVPSPGVVRRLVRRFLPLPARHALARARHAQRAALLSQVEALRLAGSSLSILAARREPLGVVAQHQPPAWIGPDNLDIRAVAQPGDVIVTLGSPWSHPGYADLILNVTAGRSLRVALLAHDLIPQFHPEWFNQDLVRTHTEWLTAFASIPDILFANSEATAHDLERWARCSGIRVSLPVRVLPIGTGFSSPPATTMAAPPTGLSPGSYVLIVSTIEARKNHLLAFRVWRRMMEEMSPDEVPTLVFAGKVGWLVADLMQQLQNCHFLDGKIVHLPEVSDLELAALYRGCRFTLFPSLYEGWGLPVTESLSFGKLCIASDRSAVPEAGGPFCLYIDPENVTSAAEVIQRACTDDAMIAEKEALIQAEFRPRAWRETAEAMIAHLQGLKIP